MNNNEVRSFPRYNCETKKISLRFQQGQSADVINLSVGGICLEGNKRIQSVLTGQQTAVMALAKQQFKLKLTCIWEMEIIKPVIGRVYRSGWALSFERMDDFQPWLILMQALEKLAAKKNGQQS